METYSPKPFLYVTYNSSVAHDGDTKHGFSIRVANKGWGHATDPILYQAKNCYEFEELDPMVDRFEDSFGVSVLSPAEYVKRMAKVSKMMQEINAEKEKQD